MYFNLIYNIVTIRIIILKNDFEDYSPDSLDFSPLGMLIFFFKSRPLLILCHFRQFIRVRGYQDCVVDLTDLIVSSCY